MYKGLINGKFEPGILSHHDKGRYAGIYTLQTITLNGFVIDTLMSEKKPITKEIKVFCMKKEGLILNSRDLKELHPDLISMRHRLSQQDVIDFYERYD